ncbi:RNA 2'-phosphotransferase, Tpt1/KptA family protein [Toxoplasma gondii TgCatPRC2]|uniref:2'-phosphotransferase n=7 Tax=Toxoplasma gondii TaxID=5811 RepID=B6KJW0_TOXGV|nr:RNA 2'-phosphotransferase, Tpt1/KptA family protein [Toxoplasma gondii ME49]ESS35805.1 RNA 2'-phosphotransferase, Tpt1/KptA family protein [Toxoplasma gondii VEG]KFG51246.1 RNA 2'-phosphotransferase, Tpt1/KptA family protein [Toxoplasma gondii p89]KFH17288.1 RNA 2'-phosphotransferase, Tpt1/KptA family protein [Toxoplasma gondii MAS]KYF46251.1 RNA 2'-phosphotransferase, Tpt1/KptA family protein [Toxoplasma gondii ARI]KYK63572.1 RNA 2'-phosphotransferase, Tpt1/KptA family protein [Toxoplasma |eukprot:XP_002368133.1 RNA 2'-phosphotransferase, Tpt1/KptA family protein [Toxoplasma gondii ME49]
MNPKLQQEKDGAQSSMVVRSGAAGPKRVRCSGKVGDRVIRRNTVGGQRRNGSPSQKENDKLYAFSRRLTKLLRHQALQRGLAISPDGFVATRDILRLPENSRQDVITEEDIITVVQTDAKQRFSLCWRAPDEAGGNEHYEEVQFISARTAVSLPQKDAGDGSEGKCRGKHPHENKLESPDSIAKLDRITTDAGPSTRTSPRGKNCSRYPDSLCPPRNNGAVLCIRANQGHSMACIDSEKLLRPVRSVSDLPTCCLSTEVTGCDSEELVATVVHGTYWNRWKRIETEGLSRMSRNHIHFASGFSTETKGVISGMRATADVLIFLDVKKALDEGLRMFVSSNDVVLSPGNERGIIETRFFSKVVDRKTGMILFRGGDGRGSA